MKKVVGLDRRIPTAPPALVTTSLDELEAAIGGREALVAALVHAPKSASLDYILGLLGTPPHVEGGRWPRKSLAALCAQGGITPGELIEAYKAGEIARAQALSLQKVGARLAEVAEDTMRRALPYEGICEACQGTGTCTPEPTKRVPNPSAAPCVTCGGSGIVRAEGDLDHKKLALDMGKLLPKSGGINLQVNQQQNTFLGGSAGGALERMQAATDAILFGAGDPAPPDVVAEGEVLESEGAEAPADAPVVEGDWREETRG